MVAAVANPPTRTPLLRPLCSLLKVSGAANLVYGVSAVAAPKAFHDLYHTSVRSRLLAQAPTLY